MHTNTEDIERLMRELHAVTAVLRDAWRREVPELSRPALATLALVFRKGPHRVSDIATSQHVDQSVASRQVKALADAGLVQIGPDPEDARGRQVSATDAGGELVRSAHARVAEIFGARLADWSEAEVTEIADALERLHETLEKTSVPMEAVPR